MKKIVLWISVLVVCFLFYAWTWEVSVARITRQERAAMVRAIEHLNRGNAFYEEKRYDLAVKEFEMAANLSSSWDAARENLDRARKMAAPEEYLELHPEDENMKKHLMEHSIEHGEWKKARGYAEILKNDLEKKNCLEMIDTLKELNASSNAWVPSVRPATGPAKIIKSVD